MTNCLNYSILITQVSLLLCADNVIIRHTPQPLYHTVKHVRTSCGAYPKNGTNFCRHSPDAIKVSEHLSNTTGQNVEIKPSDYICYTCYRTHCSIIESLMAPHGSKTSLQRSIEEWVSEYNANTTNKLTKLSLQT